MFDILESNDVIDKVIAAMPSEEYEALKSYLSETIYNILNYRTTAAAVLQSVIQDLPKNAAAAKEIVDSFDPNQYKAVIDFATAANGGRNIKTNAPVVKAPSVRTVTETPKTNPAVEAT